MTLRTDHRYLLWLDSYKDTEGVLARWLEKLASFDYTVQHRPGKSHGNANALSRLPETQAKSHSKEVTFSVTTDPNSEPQETSGEQSEDGGVVSNDQKPTNTCRETPIVPVDMSWDDQWSTDDVRAAQEENPEISKVMGWCKALLDRPIRSDPALNGANPTLLRVWSQWKRLKLVNGVLYRSFESEDDAATHLQLVVPPSLKPQILKALHDDCAGGHLGSEKTLQKVRRRFYWPFMSPDVEAYCRSCPDCEARNS